MVDGESIAVSTTEQVQPLIEEARLARVQAKEAVQRIQQRIERLEALSEALDCSKGE
jgi:phage gp45-like